MVSNVKSNTVVTNVDGIEVVIHLKPDGYPYAVTGALPSDHPNPKKLLMEVALEYARRMGLDASACACFGEAVKTVKGPQKANELMEFAKEAEQMRKTFRTKQRTEYAVKKLLLALKRVPETEAVDFINKAKKAFIEKKVAGNNKELHEAVISEIDKLIEKYQ